MNKMGAKFPLFAVAIAVVVFNFNNVIVAEEMSAPLVNVTDLGSYVGLWGRTKWTMQKYAQFLGIAYGEQLERFQPPVPIKPFNGVMDADFSKRTCLAVSSIVEMEEYQSMGAADSSCQFLSIFSKSFNVESKKAVMVYIAGYDLEKSFSRYGDPEYILEEDVIMVSIQHRVGPFGFLSTQTETIPGNAGVFDIIEALRFIKKYIKYFGGDEENITVFGQYKAAALIHLIQMTQIFREEKLFQKMILQSGSALMNGLATEDPLEIAQQIGKNMKCKEYIEVEPLNNCLKFAGVYELANAYMEYMIENPRMPYITIGGPSNLIPSPIDEIAEYAEFDGVSVMGGVVKHPAVGIGAMKSFQTFEMIAEEFGTSLAEDKAFEDYQDIIKEKFPKAAFKEVFERALWPAIVDLNSLDIKEAVGKALKYISTSNITTYMYIFNYHGADHELPEIENDQFETVALIDDNRYLFPSRNSLNRNDKKMAKIMVKLWTSFAQTSIPRAPGYVDSWPAILKDTMGPYLKIDRIFEIGWNFPEEFFTTILETKNYLESV